MVPEQAAALGRQYVQLYPGGVVQMHVLIRPAAPIRGEPGERRVEARVEVGVCKAPGKREEERERERERGTGCGGKEEGERGT